MQKIGFVSKPWELWGSHQARGADEVDRGIRPSWVPSASFLPGCAAPGPCLPLCILGLSTAHTHKVQTLRKLRSFLGQSEV